MFRACDFSGEDETCADSVPLPDSIYDHLNILGVHMSCPFSSGHQQLDWDEIRHIELRIKQMLPSLFKV